MCLGIPGRIVALNSGHVDLADVDVAGMTRRINIGILNGEPLAPGDWILIHAGFAMEKIDEEKARDALSFLSTYTADPPGVRESETVSGDEEPEARTAAKGSPS